jgi:hypothetical protein
MTVRRIPDTNLQLSVQAIDIDDRYAVSNLHAKTPLRFLAFRSLNGRRKAPKAAGTRYKLTG